MTIVIRVVIEINYSFITFDIIWRVGNDSLSIDTCADYSEYLVVDRVYSYTADSQVWRNRTAFVFKPLRYFPYIVVRW